MIWVIAQRELRALFLTPLAWVTLALVQIVLGFVFLLHVQAYLDVAPRLNALESAPGVTDLVVARFLANAAVITALIAPVLTMRTLAEERRAGTLPLLLSAPVSATELALGKYLGLLGLFAVMALMLLIMPLSLLAGTGLDMGKLSAGALGLALVLASYAAAGLFMSSLTAQPTVAALATLALLLMLWIVDSTAGAETAGLLGYLSLLRHYQPLLTGLFDTADVAYFCLLILGFVVFTILRLDAERLRG